MDQSLMDDKDIRQQRELKEYFEQVERDKFSKGKIYLISNDIDDKVYIGSTIKELDERWQQHLYKLHNISKTNIDGLYGHMHRLGANHFKIELLEAYPCNNKKELYKREGYHQLANKAALNMNIAGGKPKEQTPKTYKCKCGNTYKHGKKREHFGNTYHIEWLMRNPKEEVRCQECGLKYLVSERKAHAHGPEHNSIINCECGYYYKLKDRKHHVRHAPHYNWAQEQHQLNQGSNINIKHAENVIIH